jgi:large conductance mechanosensitive channel
MKLVNDFKAFLLRGNVVDLAIAVVIGAAFGAVVTALVQDLLTPLIAAIGGQQDFSTLKFTLHNSTFLYGDFVNKVLAFVMIAAAVFFVVIVPLNAYLTRARKEPPPDPTIRKCPQCLSAIPAEAHRCAFCTAEVVPTATDAV